MLQGDDQEHLEKLLFGLLAMLSTSTRLRYFDLLVFEMSLETVSHLALLPLSLRKSKPAKASAQRSLRICFKNQIDVCA